MKSELYGALTRQIEYNSERNLLYIATEDVIDVHPEFEMFLNNLMNSDDTDYVDTILNELISFAVNKLCESVYAINQFINISKEKIVELETIYRNTWELMCDSGDIRLVLQKSHYPALSVWLSEIYPPVIKDVLQFEKEIGKLVCEEYSPEFQLHLFGINLRNINEPVLDIGCGKHGNLVKYLKDNKVNATGIDRVVEPCDTLLPADWLEFDFENDKWGTIISNMALSNHIIYASKYDKDLYHKYIVVFGRILKSLKPGGAFFYAPGLPFLEKGISIEGFEIVKEQKFTRIARFA